MKQFVLLFAIMLGTTASGYAQTYLEHLQQKTPGLGSVTVSQSKAIDELVNGKAVPQDNKEKNTPATPQKDNKTKTTPSTTTTNNTKVSEPQRKQSPDSVKKPEHHEAATENQQEENDAPAVDMRKKVMRSSYKVTGYRVQAYAGGNSRADRQKAEQIGNAIKMKFPEQPVYVHFYSPRWICRIGNFRSLPEAQKMLAKVRAMGYKQACLVKGKITVQD